MRPVMTFIVSVGILLFLGCTEKDAENIRKVSSKALDKAATFTESAGEKFGLRLPGAKAGAESVELGARVESRLRWDQQLQGASIKVDAADGNVTLKGTVKDETQRKRAVELAQSTEGVKRIADVMGVKRQD